jgi:hypothetical protein
MRPGLFFFDILVASKRSGFSVFAGSGRPLVYAKKLSPLLVERSQRRILYYQPIVEQKRSEPGMAEKHRDALIGELEYAELGAESSARCGRDEVTCRCMTLHGCLKPWPFCLRYLECVRELQTEMRKGKEAA